MSKIPSASSFVAANTSDLAEFEEHAISTRRLFLMLGVSGAVFWSVLGFFVYSVLS